MSLLIRPPNWTICSTNQSGTPSANPGGLCTAGANNADGTIANSGLGVLSHDVEHLRISIAGYVIAATNLSTLLDILIDPAGGTTWATAPLIPTLIAGWSPSPTGDSHPGINYHFPIFIRAGATLGFRARTAHTATRAGTIQLAASGANSNPGTFWCGQYITAYGITAAASKGTDHTPGNTGTFSSWTDFGSPLSAPAYAIQFAIHGLNSSATVANSLQYHWEFGVGGVRIGPAIFSAISTNEGHQFTNTGLIYRSLPEGAQLQVRATCSGTAQLFDIAAYAVH